MRTNPLFFSLVLIFLAGFCLRPGITSIAPTTTDIQQHFTASDATIGLLTTIPVICMGLLSPLAYLLQRRINLKRTLLLGLLSVFIGEAIRLIPQWIALLLFSALLIGIGDALVRPLLSGFIKARCSTHSRLAVSIYATSIGVGSSCAAIFTTAIGQFFNGYHFGLSIWALPTLMCLLSFALFTNNSEKPAQTITLRQAPSRLTTVALVLLFGLQSGLNYSISAWLPKWLIAQGTARSAAEQYTFLFIIGATLTSLCYPLLVRICRNLSHDTALVASACLLLGLIAYMVKIPFWFSIIMTSIGIGILFPLVLELPVILTANSAQAVKLSGMVQTAGYILGGSVPTLVGWISSHREIITALNLTVAVMISAITILSVWLSVRITKQP